MFDNLKFKTIKWWEYLVLIFLPSQIHREAGYVFKCKIWRDHIYFWSVDSDS